MKKKILALLALLVFLWSQVPALVALATTEDELNDKKKKIEELQNKLKEVQGEKQSLSSTISYLTTKVDLTESQIAETSSQIQLLEVEIDQLSGKINTLNLSLEKLTVLLLNRVNATYKNSVTKPIYLLFSSEKFSYFFKRYKYLKESQENDREVMYQLEKARTDFDNQKTLKEEKQQEVEVLQGKLKKQEAELEGQKAVKEAALAVTKNDEKRYQNQLATALAELEAIQSIIAGKGNETEAGEVKEGDNIASVIPSASACSNGAHLHFEVAKDGVHLNPAGYLGSHSVTWDNGPDSPFGFSGDWRWPLNDPIRITQGYGMTFYASTLRYYGGAPHTGIDMMTMNGDNNVKAVKEGKLFRGGIACGGGTLRYVRVEHNDGDYSTYYLHVNY